MKRRLQLALILIAIGVASSVRAAPDNLYFVRDGIHTELAVPAALAAAYLHELDIDWRQAQHWRIGWGDRSYFGKGKRGLLINLKALLLPSMAALRIQPLQPHPELELQPLALADDDALGRHLSHSLARRHGKPRRIRAAGGAHYYRASGIYCWLRNCNHWSATGLRRSGQQVYYQQGFLAPQLQARVRAIAP